MPCCCACGNDITDCCCACGTLGPAITLRGVFSSACACLNGVTLTGAITFPGGICTWNVQAATNGACAGGSNTVVLDMFCGGTPKVWQIDDLTCTPTHPICTDFDLNVLVVCSPFMIVATFDGAEGSFCDCCCGAGNSCILTITKV